MYRNLIIGIVVAIVVVGLGFVLLSGRYNNMGMNNNGNNPTPTVPNQVNIQNYSFNPDNMTVKVGTTVTWVNNDSTSHTVTSDSGDTLKSATLAPGDKFQFTFTNAGNFPYHCSIHTYMKGTIVVQ